MTSPGIIETFNTHRMLPDVVRALATGRDDELHELLQAIRQAVTHPGTPPQHIMVYGERGSGKSFLMRLVELAGESLARAETLPLAFVLLPEEQYNIKTAPQLLEAVAARVRGADWSASAYSFDVRPAAPAWEAAVQALSQAMEQRFGKDRGLVVAMIENFDTVAKNLFGAEALVSSTRQTAASAVAIERRAAEERLREFLGRNGARFMLIATATKTVDLDYDRPLFLAFKALDLTAWTPDTCLEYFHKRRRLAGAPALTLSEAARARAIAEFIGGNPRLAQLLAEVLHVLDARTIAQTLDALSDHLADYYRRRLDDLPANAAGLLDALIRTGEPCSQSALAQRVGAEQKHIADAFSYLVRARLLAADRERHGHGTLYRVRDRLFVHFYRRRYGGEDQAVGLAPIVELLAVFFSTKERSEMARRYLEAGEFSEARLLRGLDRPLDGGSKGYDGFRDQLVTGAVSKLWECAGLTPAAIEPARCELRDEPDKACKRWGDAAQAPQPALQRTVAKLLQAVAASRLDDDAWAQQLLAEALEVADTDVTPDARILTVDRMAFFSWYRLKDRQRALEQWASLQEWVNTALHTYAKIRAHLGKSASAGAEGRHHEAIQAAETAASLARSLGDAHSLTMALRYKGWSLGQLGQHEEALVVSAEAATLAQQAGDVREQAENLRHRAWSLGELGRHEEAIIVSAEAATLAQQAGDVGEQAVSLRYRAWNLGQLKRIAEAITAFDQATALAIEAKDRNEFVQDLRLKSALLLEDGQWSAALETIRAALTVDDPSVTTQEKQWSCGLFFQIVAQTPAPEALARLTQVVTESTADDRWFDIYLDDVMAAVTRVEDWAALQTCVREHQDWFANAQSSFGIFSNVGKVWSDFVKTRGRATAFALVARDLPVMADVMTRIETALLGEPGTPSQTHRRELIAGVVSACDDPGFVRDLAPLVVEVFGADAEDEAQRLRAFADFHAAADKEKVLQRFDPDLAKAIRRMWNVPEPEDLLARRGRPKGR